MEKSYIPIDESKIEICSNKNGNINFFYDNCYWRNHYEQKFYCWTCFSYNQKMNIGIILEKGCFYIKEGFQHNEKCIEAIDKIKTIKEFMRNFKKEESEYRKIIEYFKTKIKDKEIAKDKIELAKKAEKMLENNKDIIFGKKKVKIANHYEIMAEILEELNKLNV